MAGKKGRKINGEKFIATRIVDTRPFIEGPEEKFTFHHVA